MVFVQENAYVEAVLIIISTLLEHKT